MKAYALLFAACFLALPAGAAHAPGHVDAPAKQLSEGEVRKVDLEAQKLTIKHGPLTNLDMPPMTMVFRVKDPAFLEGIKPGSKIRFQAEKIGGAYTVTQIEAVK